MGQMDRAMVDFAEIERNWCGAPGPLEQAGSTVAMFAGLV